MSHEEAHKAQKIAWANSVLAAIIMVACLLSAVWAFRVPLLQNPDESSHIDYVFSIYSAGRLLNVRTPPSEWNVHRQFEGRKDREGPESTPYDLLSHQYTLYLIDATDFHRIRFHPDEKVPADYGTKEYFQRLTANAPRAPARIPDLGPQDNPWMITAYPFFYYAVAALFQKVVTFCNGGPVWLFLGVRFLSGFFLAGSLILIYAIVRELRLTKMRALMVTAIVAFFPMVIFVSSSVQPDNLTMLLMLLCSYCALLFKRQQSNVRLQIVLGLALGALLVTKYHIFLFTAFAAFGVVITEHLYHRRPMKSLLRQLAILLVPSLLLFMVQLWIVWGGGQITGGNLHFAYIMRWPRGIRNAIYDYYQGGQTWISWWGTFGWGDAYLIFGSPSFQAYVWKILLIATMLLIALVIARLTDVLAGLVKVLRRRNWRVVLRVLFSNPLLTNYFLFSVFMVLLYAVSDNSFYAQGRHWFPYTLPGFLTTVHFAPHVFRKKATRNGVSTTLMIALLIYCALGAYFALNTIKDRYYPPVTSSESR